MHPVIKQCGCGKEYTKQDWDRLSLLPKQGGKMRYADGQLYEFRVCVGCHSTLARTVTEQPTVRRSFPTPAQPIEFDQAMLRVRGPSK